MCLCARSLDLRECRADRGRRSHVSHIRLGRESFFLSQVAFHECEILCLKFCDSLSGFWRLFEVIEQILHLCEIVVSVAIIDCFDIRLAVYFFGSPSGGDILVPLRAVRLRRATWTI